MPELVKEMITEYANSVFEQPWWMEAVAPGKWKEVFVKDGEEIIARWVFCQNNNAIYMPRLTQTAGPWIKKNSSIFKEQAEQEKKCIYELLDQMPRKTSICLALDPSLEYFLPFVWRGFHVIPRVSYQIQDLTDLEQVYKGFSKNIRRDIKVAEKKLHISDEPSVEILMEIMKKTFAEQKRKYPVPKELIERVLTYSIRYKSGKMLTALDEENHVHAAAVFVYDKNTCYYLIGGKDSSYKTSNAPTLLIWEGIKMASKVSEKFDFEGSMIEGIEGFFKRFGGIPVVYYEISRLSFWEKILQDTKPTIKKILGYR